MTQPLDAFIRALPKVELHVHLEGSVHPHTLRELARQKGRLTTETESWIREQQARNYRYGSLQEFLKAFKLVTLLLDTPQDYGFAALRLFESLAAQQVRYAEITLSAGVILWKNQSLPDVFEALQQAAQEADARLSLRVRWIFDAIRQFGAEHARKVLHWAEVYHDDGVVAFGIGGDEERGPAELFAGVFRDARESGLHVTAHAGETAGPDSVRQAVERLGAERIGHGVSAIRDPELMELLAARRVPLELCLTSNVATGIVSSLAEHPLPHFLRAGLCVTVNSDDPAMFGTTLEDELMLLGQTFGLEAEEIAEICANAARASFQEAEAKQTLLAEIHDRVLASSR